jgi:hypothetical protein
MCFYGSARHFELAGNFCVVTALQKQFDDLLFARAKAYGLLVHQLPLFLTSPSAQYGARAK